MFFLQYISKGVATLLENPKNYWIQLMLLETPKFSGNICFSPGYLLKIWFILNLQLKCYYFFYKIKCVCVCSFANYLTFKAHSCKFLLYLCIDIVVNIRITLFGGSRTPLDIMNMSFLYEAFKLFRFLLISNFMLLLCQSIYSSSSFFLQILKSVNFIIYWKRYCNFQAWDS